MKFLNGFKKTPLVLAIGSFLLLGCGSAFAQGFAVNATFDENGNGLLTTTNGFSGALPSGMLADPGPGGLPAVLFYDLLNPPGLTGGDVLVFEDETGQPGDVLRFDPNATLGNDTGGVFVYSLNDGDGSLADIGLPGGLNTNLITVTESGGMINYTPTAGQPGFVAGASGPVTFSFISDAPEPGSILLLTGGLAFLGVRLRRKTQRSNAA